MKTFNFSGWECQLRFGSYSNGRTAIKLTNANIVRQDGFIFQPGSHVIAVATVNILECPLMDDEVIIKDYSENEGMLRCLVDAGVISEPVRYVPTGFVTCPICKLLIKP